MKELDDLANEYRSILARFNRGDISADEYLNRTANIGREYIRLLDSLETAKPIDQMEVIAK